jgi:hypothetical protein
MDVPETPPELIGTCSHCGYLAYCEERLNARRRRILVCAECQAERGEPMLPLAPLPRPRPPARETQGQLFDITGSAAG